MTSKYYKLWYFITGNNRYLIWYSNEQDGVFVDAKGKVPSFASVENLLSYAETRGIIVELEEPHLHNLDLLVRWLKKPDAKSVSCNEFNNAWNLFSDVSASINGNFDSDKKLTQKIYDKLFWGCNLPAVTPEGKQYHHWTKRELQLMHDVLLTGVEMFEQAVIYWEDYSV